MERQNHQYEAESTQAEMAAEQLGQTKKNLDAQAEAAQKLMEEHDQLTQNEALPDVESAYETTENQTEDAPETAVDEVAEHTVPTADQGNIVVPFDVEEAKYMKSEVTAPLTGKTAQSELSALFDGEVPMGVMSGIVTAAAAEA